MSNLSVRIVSAVLMAVVCTAAMVVDVRSRWAVLAGFLSLAAWEWSRMIRAKLGGPEIAWAEPQPAVIEPCASSCCDWRS